MPTWFLEANNPYLMKQIWYNKIKDRPVLVCNVREGFRNNGNTCFINAALQCLRHLPTIIDLLGDFLDTNSRIFAACAPLTTALYKLLQDPENNELLTSFEKTFHEQILLYSSSYSVSFQKGGQADSSEFLSSLLMVLDAEMSERHPFQPFLPHYCDVGRYATDLYVESRTASNSFISSLLRGIETETFTCSKCGYQSVRLRNFTKLDLRLPEQDYATLEECFQLYYGSGSGTDKNCDNCGAIKAGYTCKRDLLMSPPVLFLSIEPNLEKKCILLLPPFLDLSGRETSSNYMLPEPHYRLLGVIRHRPGHYVADIVGDDVCKRLDDSLCREILIDEALQDDYLFIRTVIYIPCSKSLTETLRCADSSFQPSSINSRSRSVPTSNAPTSGSLPSTSQNTASSLQLCPLLSTSTSKTTPPSAPTSANSSPIFSEITLEKNGQSVPLQGLLSLPPLQLCSTLQIGQNSSMHTTTSPLPPSSLLPPSGLPQTTLPSPFPLSPSTPQGPTVTGHSPTPSSSPPFTFPQAPQPSSLSFPILPMPVRAPSPTSDQQRHREERMLREQEFDSRSSFGSIFDFFQSTTNFGANPQNLSPLSTTPQSGINTLEGMTAGGTNASRFGYFNGERVTSEHGEEEENDLDFPNIGPDNDSDDGERVVGHGETTGNSQTNRNQQRSNVLASNQGAGGHTQSPSSQQEEQRPRRLVEKLGAECANNLNVVRDGGGIVRANWIRFHSGYFMDGHTSFALQRNAPVEVPCDVQLDDKHLKALQYIADLVRKMSSPVELEEIVKVVKGEDVSKIIFFPRSGRKSVSSSSKKNGIFISEGLAVILAVIVSSARSNKTSTLLNEPLGKEILRAFLIDGAAFVDAHVSRNSERLKICKISHNQAFQTDTLSQSLQKGVERVKEGKDASGPAGSLLSCLRGSLRKQADKDAFIELLCTNDGFMQSAQRVCAGNEGELALKLVHLKMKHNMSLDLIQDLHMLVSWLVPNKGKIAAAFNYVLLTVTKLLNIRYAKVKVGEGREEIVGVHVPTEKVIAFDLLLKLYQEDFSLATNCNGKFTMDEMVAGKQRLTEACFQLVTKGGSNQKRNDLTTIFHCFYGDEKAVPYIRPTINEFLRLKKLEVDLELLFNTLVQAVSPQISNRTRSTASKFEVLRRTFKSFEITTKVLKCVDMDAEFKIAGKKTVCKGCDACFACTDCDGVNCEKCRRSIAYVEGILNCVLSKTKKSEDGSYPDQNRMEVVHYGLRVCMGFIIFVIFLILQGGGKLEDINYFFEKKMFNGTKSLVASLDIPSDTTKKIQPSHITLTSTSEQANFTFLLKFDLVLKEFAKELGTVLQKSNHFGAAILDYFIRSHCSRSLRRSTDSFTLISCCSRRQALK